MHTSIDWPKAKQKLLLKISALHRYITVPYKPYRNECWIIKVDTNAYKVINFFVTVKSQPIKGNKQRGAKNTETYSTHTQDTTHKHIRKIIVWKKCNVIRCRSHSHAQTNTQILLDKIKYNRNFVTFFFILLRRHHHTMYFRFITSSYSV